MNIDDHPTPAVDAFIANRPIITGRQWTDFARALERQNAALREALSVLLDSCDYTTRMCSPAAMVAVAIPPKLLTHARAVLDATKP